jgi:tetratricopeptide (TPR) repeat protein
MTRAAVAVALLLAAAACHARPGSAELLADGWALYGRGEFAAALDAFTQAVQRARVENDEVALGSAFNGQGWSDLRLHALPDALDAFDEAVMRAGDGADSLAGRAGTRLATALPGGARDDADAARALDPTWASFHDPLDARALTVTALLASLRLGDLERAQSELDVLAPGNGLAPGDPSSWVAGGSPLPTYAAALLVAAQEAAAL